MNSKKAERNHVGRQQTVKMVLKEARREFKKATDYVLSRM